MKTEGKNFIHCAKAFNELQEFKKLVEDLQKKTEECKFIVQKYCTASADADENYRRFGDLQAYVNDQTGIADIKDSCHYFTKELEEFDNKRNELSDKLFDSIDGAEFNKVSAECRDTILKLKSFGVLVRSLHLAMMQFIGLRLDNDNQFSTLCEAFDVVVRDMHNGNRMADVFVGQYKAYILDWVYQTGYFDEMK